MLDAKTSALIDKMLAGDRLALARLITRVENRAASVAEIMRRVHGRMGRAYILGITGPPGSGKSTVVDRLTALLRAEGASVGIVAVDPSSPFSGGAVLGDRIRMQSHTLDPEVFIRSMLAAAGYAWVLIETVGVGQTELDIMKLADTTVVVLVPESGDAIQTMKAGLMEVADVLVVNKADRAGANPLMTELRFMAHLQRTSPQTPKDIDWEIPVLATQAQNDVGIVELLAAIRGHRGVLESTGALDKRRRARRRAELQALLVEELTAEVSRRLGPDGDLAPTFEAVAAGRIDPYSAVRKILKALAP
ncbi:MAG: methylmalonyl Co-A mutase-associated GTPase MeaB [Candidatus Rokubacteria bacterium]|nr:methylmalonyl Co-A mutase-associated GTPase MeaB [Candidatus Rokubacteria bacterium]